MYRHQRCDRLSSAAISPSTSRPRKGGSRADLSEDPGVEAGRRRWVLVARAIAPQGVQRRTGTIFLELGHRAAGLPDSAPASCALLNPADSRAWVSRARCLRFRFALRRGDRDTLSGEPRVGASSEPPAATSVRDASSELDHCARQPASGGPRPGRRSASWRPRSGLARAARSSAIAVRSSAGAERARRARMQRLDGPAFTRPGGRAPADDC